MNDKMRIYTIIQNIDKNYREKVYEALRNEVKTRAESQNSRKNNGSLINTTRFYEDAAIV